MPVRRSAETIWVQHIWDAIYSYHAQRQMADLTRITKYLQRLYDCTQLEAELHVKQAVDDGLLMSLQKVTVKGSKLGTQVESYKVPVNERPTAIRDNRDWYCFDCHLPGDVVACKSCFRVYHETCSKVKKIVPLSFLENSNNRASVLSNMSNSASLEEGRAPSVEGDCSSEVMDTLGASLSVIVNNVEKQLKKMEEFDTIVEDNEEKEVKSEDTDEVENNESSNDAKDETNIINKVEEIVYDENRCGVCNNPKMEPNIDLGKEELNYLLTFVYSRICSWLPRNITEKMSSEEVKAEWHTEADQKWRAQQLFYVPMDMNIIKSKLDAQGYNTLSEFKADVLTVQHNVFIYHGPDSQEVGAAEYMLKDCCYDISEILNCADCYKHSNEKLHNHWFCLPCRNPHMLVWAKQKGYPYWPAKVIKETEKTCDVRFFGGKYERSVLPKLYVKPIKVNKNNIRIKKSSSFNKSVEELELHQKMLKDPSTIPAYKLTKKRKSPKSIKSVLKKPKLKDPNEGETDKKESETFDIYNFDTSASNLDSNEPSKPLRNKKLPTPPPEAEIKSLDRLTSNETDKNESQNSTLDGFDDSSFVVQSDSEDCTQTACEEFEEKGCDRSNEEVSSSTEQIKEANDALMPQTDREYSESVEKTRRKLQQGRDKQQLIKVALECMQAEIDRINLERDDYLKKIFESHNNQISETKKKQWCYNCEQDAIYHCCWNTAYCSPTCQQHHWQAEHKKVCRRKR